MFAGIIIMAMVDQASSVHRFLWRGGSVNKTVWHLKLRSDTENAIVHIQAQR